MRSLILALTVSGAACGGGSHAKPKQPTEPEKPDAYLAWHDAEPKSPEQPLRSTKFEPPQRCGQGPYRFTVDSAAAKYSESLRITMCTVHEFKGSISYVPPGKSWGKSESGFDGKDARNDQCRVDATVVATQTSGSTTGGRASGSGPRGKADPAATAKPVAMELHGTLIDTGARCPDGTREVQLANTSYTAGGDFAPVEKGAFTIEVWSELPNDLAGTFFVVHQKAVPAGYKLDDWMAYRRAHDAWYAQHDAALAQAIADGHKWRTIEPTKATRQPPPARAEIEPPKPSLNATWIPGYWQDNNGWEWSAGFWRVPQQDIEQEKTVEAPSPPPPPRLEATPPPAEIAVHHRAVWTPGHWMWNGRGYIWIAGAWRIPETSGMVWVAPTWRPSRRGTLLFVPGGFVRRR